MSGFLPITREEMLARGWDQVDFVLVTGDAYVDHPSFGLAVIARVLEAEGYRVGIVSQPRLDGPEDFLPFGLPRLAFMVTAGNIDSMVAHYTAAKRRRSDDAYTPGGKAGRRPDRAVTVYCRKIREYAPGVPLIIGGIEASLRRFAHYDYWEDKVHPSVLLSSGADLLSYGMGELQTRQLARRLAAGEPIEKIRDIRGTCYLCRQEELPEDYVTCASFAKVSVDKPAHARACRIQLENHDHVYGKTIVQKQTNELFLVQNPPMRPLTQEEFDQVAQLPYMRMYHPSYEKLGGVKAIEEVEFSVIHNRGCFGACNFCSIAFHQGRHVTTRSVDSVVREVEAFTHSPRFKGYVHDVGGPTANFRVPSCKKQEACGLCPDRKCLAPEPCPALQIDHREFVSLLRRLRQIKGVKKIFIRSGLRYDYIVRDPDDTFFRDLVTYHVSGQLKVAPEHCSAPVLDMMGKPHIQAYERFSKKFYEITKSIGKEQYLVPYLMSSHPGSHLSDAVELALFLKRHHIRPEQVQDFYPTPGTVSTCMFFTGINPYTMKEVYVPRSMEEKHLQRTLLQYFKPENRSTVIRALILAHREDLIGTGPGCLVPPDRKYLEEHRRQRDRQPQPGGKGARRPHGKTKKPKKK